MKDLDVLKEIEERYGISFEEEDINTYNETFYIQRTGNIVSLGISDLQINDLEELTTYLRKFFYLNFLSLDNNEISDIGSLSFLSGLESLYLNNNRISDIGSLSSLTNLESLYLNNNRISDIGSLSFLSGLESLSLENNEISEISSLFSLVNLDSLYLDHNKISEIESLSSLSNLISLSLSCNQITFVPEWLFERGIYIIIENGETIGANPIKETPPLKSSNKEMRLFYAILSGRGNRGKENCGRQN